MEAQFKNFVKNHETNVKSFCLKVIMKKAAWKKLITNIQQKGRFNQYEVEEKFIVLQSFLERKRVQ